MRSALKSFLADIRYGMRTLRKTPEFALTAILTIGLGIGGITAVFSVVNGVLLRPLPYPDSDRVALLWRLAPLGSNFGPDEYPWGRLDYSMFRQQQTIFAALGAFEPATFNLTSAGEPLMVEGAHATAGFASAIGVRPAIGRFFSPEEDRPGYEHVAVLSDRLWRSRFSARRDIVGQSIRLNGFTYTVVGVMPPGFDFPHGAEMPASLEFPRRADLWTPMAIAPGERGPNQMAVIGRLRPGAQMTQIQAQLDRFGVTFERAVPAAKGWTRSRAVSLRTQIVGPSTRPLLLLLAAVGLLLLIVISNIAGLVLTRALGRQREFDLRSALGAGRWRLMRQLLAENLLLAICGGALGLVCGAVAIAWAKNAGPPNLPRLQEVSLDPAVLLFSLAVTALAGIACGLAPGVAAARGNLAESLRAGGRGLAGQTSPKMRSALLTAQIALALMLTIAAGLLVRTFQTLVHSERGFQVDHVLTFELSLPPAKYPNPDRMAELYSRALTTLQALPGVEAVGFVHAVPMGGAPDATMIRVPGRISKPNEMPYANYMFASPGYFAAVRTPLLQGRDFNQNDTLAAPAVTVVNRAMADALWPGQNAVGKQVGVALTRYPVRTVVGVVANVKQTSLREDVAPQMYVPFTQNEIKVWPPMGTMQVAVRTVGDAGQMTAAIGKALHGVDPELPLANVATLDRLVKRSLSQPQFAMFLMAAFGLLALTLASVGMYGVISYSVAQRTQEIGVRMALGAGRVRILWMVLAQGGRLAAAGLVIGLVGALFGVRLFAGFLYGIKPEDPVSFALAAGLILFVILAAGYLPARRAAEVNPAISLRQD